jgi:serine/threonine-protein kinase RsbW
VSASDEVLVRVPADPTYVAVLRTTTAVLAARLDFSIDEIEDLRIVVDEAAALLIAKAADGEDLECRLRTGDNGLTLTLSCPLTPGAVPAQDGFAWTVLQALSDDVQLGEQDGAATVSVVRRRVGSRGDGG